MSQSQKIKVIVTVLLIVFALDFYGYLGIRYLIRKESELTRYLVTGAYWFMTILIVLLTAGYLMGVIDRSSLFFRTLLFGGLFVNYLPKLVLVFFVLSDDIVRLVKWLVEFFQAPSETGTSKGGITRSDFLLKTGVIASALPLMATVGGILYGAHNYKVRRKTLSFPNLPPSFDGLKIVQISDIHTGSFFDKDAVRKGVEMVTSLKADLVFFTGDLVNDKSEEVVEYISMFSQITAPMGVYSVLGNHDYGDYVAWPTLKEKEENLEQLKKHHADIGWKLMLDENISLKSASGESIALIGVENWGDGFAQYGDLDKAYQGAEKEPFKILLSHDPTHWTHQVRPKYKDIDLTLSGHTHGMQMGIKIGNMEWSPSSLRYKHWGGLYEEEGQYLYVNRGFGYIGFPGRIGMPPEITLLELKKA
jgi:hypothetical protein